MVLEWLEIREEDYPAVRKIFNYYVDNTTVTLAAEKISFPELKKKIPLGDPKYKAFIIRFGANLIGFCYLSPYRNKAAYDRSAEVTVYLKPEFTGRGIGKEALFKLESVASENGIRVLVATITAGNTASEIIFEKCGYQKCAHFRQVGQKFNRLFDLVAWQKLLDD